MDSALSLMAFNAPLSTLSTITRSYSTLSFTHGTSTLSFSLRAALPSLRRRHKFISNSSSGNGNGGVRGESGGGGGGDDGGPGGGDVDSKLLAGEAEDDATLSTDGMTCKGCSASVKRILESQPQVSHATVDLASETAIVWPVVEAKITPKWREELGQALAKHLTTCGFSSKVQGQGAIGGDVSL